MAAVAEQDAARTPGRAHPLGVGGAIGAVTDQRATDQHLRRRIDRPQHIGPQRLQRRDAGCLRRRIPALTDTQRLNKPLVKHRRPGTQHLILLPISAKHRRNRRRHLILSRNHHLCRRPRRRRMSRPHRPPNTGHIPRRRRQRPTISNNKRHRSSPQQTRRNDTKTVTTLPVSDPEMNPARHPNHSESQPHTTEESGHQK